MAVEISRLYKGKQDIQSTKENLNYEKKFLHQLVSGEEAVIVNVPANPFLASLGFRANKTVTVIAREVLNGPLLCSIDGRNVVIGQDVAQDIAINY